MYDAFNQKIKNRIKAQETFILYRKPKETLVWLWGGNKKESKDRFVIQSFRGKQIYIYDDSPLKIEESELDISHTFPLPKSDASVAISKSKYLALVNQTIDKLKNTEIGKIVISRVKEKEIENVDVFKTYKNLLKSYPKAFVYLWFHPTEGVWIGATPELLLKSNHKHIYTVALAATKEKEKEWTEKEYKEQNIVTQYIANALSACKTLEIDGPHTTDVGLFEHLKSYITAELNEEQTISEIVEALHPTPAVCGYPTDLARAYILENEGYDRSYYAGYLGIETENNTEYYVNLRCAQLFQNKVKFYVGGGVMPDSEAEKEWQETEMKSKTIGDLLVF